MLLDFNPLNLILTIKTKKDMNNEQQDREINYGIGISLWIISLIVGLVLLNMGSAATGAIGMTGKVIGALLCLGDAMLLMKSVFSGDGEPC